MTTNQHSRRERSAAQRAAVLEGVRRRTRGPLAPRRTRGLLAFAYLAAVGVAAVSALFPSPGGPIGSLVGLVAFLGLLFALRRGTRLTADAPSEALDELMTRLRDRCFVMAYQGLAAGVSLACVVLWLLPQAGEGLRPEVAAALGWLLFGLALGLPVVVTALTLPDVTPETEVGRSHTAG